MIVNGLEHSPGAHGGGVASLVGKLEIIQIKLDTIEDNEYPINDLQEDATNSDAPIVLTDIDASKLVLDDGD